MSATAMRWAWTVQADPNTRVGLSAHQLLLCLADRYNTKSHDAWPSYSDITTRTGQSKSTIQRNVDELQQQGLIKAVPKLTRAGRFNGYRYLFPLLDHGLQREIQGYRFPNGTYDADAAEELQRDGYSF